MTKNKIFSNNDIKINFKRIQTFSTNQKMMKILFFVLAVLLLGANSKTLGEALGYPKDARILIVNADDFGMSYSENKG
jgi:uncharacterized membrane protein YdbT with pleckstrin-like domain